jgi:hypothetical protein
MVCAQLKAARAAADTSGGVSGLMASDGGEAFAVEEHAARRVGGAP